MEEKRKEEAANVDSRMMTWLGDHFFKSFATFFRTTTFKGRINAASLPTSSTGLAVGDIWVDTTAGNVLKIVT